MLLDVMNGITITLINMIACFVTSRGTKIDIILTLKRCDTVSRGVGITLPFCYSRRHHARWLYLGRISRVRLYDWLVVSVLMSVRWCHDLLSHFHRRRQCWILATHVVGPLAAPQPASRKTRVLPLMKRLVEVVGRVNVFIECTDYFCIVVGMKYLYIKVLTWSSGRFCTMVDFTFCLIW